MTKVQTSFPATNRFCWGPVTSTCDVRCGNDAFYVPIRFTLGDFFRVRVDIDRYLLVTVGIGEVTVSGFTGSERLVRGRMKWQWLELGEP